MFNSPPYTNGKSIQQIAKEKAREENRELRTIREAHMMMLLKHPNIVGLKDLVIQGPYFYILMDYVGGGQLLHYIVKRQRLSDRRTRLFTRQIVSALDYLHRNSIVHRDLKIENIMIDKSGRQIKIIDFGLSNLFCPERLLTTYCGSLYFAAPELLRANPYRGPEVDIWSLGVVIYVMATGAVPFDDKSMPGLHEKIKKGHVTYPSHMSEECKDLLSKIFITDPSKRIIMTDIIHHPWLNKDAAPIKNHMPLRKPLTLPLDPKVIERMSQGFQLGTTEDIEQKLTLIILSPVYKNALQYIEDCHAKKPLTPPLSYQEINDGIVYDDPQSVPAAYHPYLSLYYLAAEKQASQEHQAAHRVRSIKRSLSRKGSVESIGGGTSSARSSQTSLVDEAPHRPLAEVPINQTPITIASSAAISTNYLSRIQRWLRSSLSQHQLPSESHMFTVPPPSLPQSDHQPNTQTNTTATTTTTTTTVVAAEDSPQLLTPSNSAEKDITTFYTDSDDNTTLTATAGSGAHTSNKSLFRKLSKAILRKESSKSLNKKPSNLNHPPTSNHSTTTATTSDSSDSSSEAIDKEDIPPPVPPKDNINYTYARGTTAVQPPPGMSVATLTSRQTAHTVDFNTAIAQAKEGPKQTLPPTPQLSRSSSLAVNSNHRRKGSVTRLTGKIGSWLNRSSSVKHHS